MPVRAENINAFDLNLLKALINFKINKNYAQELTTYDKFKLCKSYDKDGILNIPHSYVIRIWTKGKGISHSVTVATLNQLCGVLKKDYRWVDFINDVSKFRPDNTPANKTYLALNNNQKEQIDKAITEIFFRYKKFEDFSNVVIDKIESLDEDNKIKRESINKTEQETDQIIAFAYKIYVELSTRKAAIPIDEDNDVIEEIYDSWYKLFCLIREEMKLLPPKYFINQNGSSHIIESTLAILNETLRSHLTKHQAKFRQWFQKAKAGQTTRNANPQMMQRKYPAYKSLIISIKEVNEKLATYSKELHNFIERE